jgi:TRAP-type uncharacterized transport system substrate-binding protein
MTARRSPRARRSSRLWVGLVVVAVLAALAWMAATIGNPFPPRTVVMATGPEGSAYREFGERYREVLRRSGVDVRLVTTAGGVENLSRLEDPRSDVSIAFLEGGVTNREKSPDLVSLGTVTLEPVWMFFRGTLQGTVAQRVAGKRISIEPEGSATRVIMRMFLALNGVDEASVELLGLSPEEGAEALVRGDIDGAIMVTSWQSPAVRKLLVAEGIVLQGHPRADAYVARFPSLSKVVLPTGVADFARNIPPEDVPILAVEASLAVRKSLHPGLQYLLLAAAAEIHGGPDVFYRAGRFPSPVAINLPLSDQAQSFYKSGRPFVYRYLPFWVAGLAEHLLVVLIPLFTVVFPIAHFLPAVYGSFINRRIYNLYGELKFLEAEMETASPGAAARELDELAKRANRLRVPLGYAQRLFILKSHIAIAQEEARKRQRSGSGPERPADPPR